MPLSSSSFKKIFAVFSNLKVSLPAPVVSIELVASPVRIPSLMKRAVSFFRTTDVSSAAYAAPAAKVAAIASAKCCFLNMCFLQLMCDCLVGVITHPLLIFVIRLTLDLAQSAL
jgi:hypothetical protein